MKFKKKEQTPFSEIIKRKDFLKKELKQLILKSILLSSQIKIKKRNFNKNILSKNIFTKIEKNIKIETLKKSFVSHKKIFMKKYSSRLSRQLNCCLRTGKRKTTLKISSISRYSLKNFLDLGLVQNITRKN